MSLRIGIDIGSTTVKVVVLDEQNKLLFRSYERHYSKARERSVETLRSIRDKLAGVHKGFRLEAHFRAAFQRLSQNIARRNGGYSEMFADNFCLGAFTGTRCT